MTTSGTDPRHTRVQTSLGTYVLASEDVHGAPALTGLWRHGQKHFPSPAQLGPAAPEDPLLLRAAKQLTEYLEGERLDFDLPLAPHGTAFQQRVWEVLRGIERGHTRSYGQIARTLGSPRGAQAVGGAVGRNPLSIIVPCHRVLSTQGAVTGYAGGTATKRALLALEGVEVEAG